ncbi:MAG: AsmA-like C-terminal region-containing protein [Candidatus Omnitrophica bacterium]|nr:AsmA-like C-terminal region-containing protein [Candidatus Omnitrophota bacterium]MBU4479444.1 AsmA-like C-terminal region-containing protein [Candidatus Omnitrophota bacterium]
MAKKIILIVSIVLAVLIAAIAAVVFYLNNVYVPKHLKPLAIELAEKSLQKKVSIEKAVYFPFRGVVFSGIKIMNQDATPFLEIEKIDLNLKSLPKIKGAQVSAQARLLVQGIVFRQQQLTVKGSSNVEVDILTDKKEKLNFTARAMLDNLEVLGLGVITDINRISGTIVCTQDSFSSEKISAFIGAQELAVIFAGTYDTKSVQLKQFSAVYGKTSLVAHGQISDMQSLQMDAVAEAALDLPDVGKIVSAIPLPALSGVCNIKAALQGPLTNLETLTANAQLSMSAAGVDKIKFSDFKANAELKEGTVYCPLLKCVFYEGSINATAKMGILFADLPMECVVDVEQVKVEPLIKDFIGQELGAGVLNAHAGLSGSIINLKTLAGSGWFKLLDAQLKVPARFEDIAKAINLPRLSQMIITKASATFNIASGKVETQDLVLLSKVAEVNGKGCVDLDQNVDFELRFKLAQGIEESSDNLAQLSNIVSQITGIKIYDKITQLKWKPILSVGKDVVKDVVTDKITSEVEKKLKELIPGGAEDGTAAEKQEIKQQIQEGLKRLFKK